MTKANRIRSCSRVPILLPLTCLALAAAPVQAGPGEDIGPDVLTPPGDFVHAVGSLVLTTTNYGLIGGHPRSELPLADQPPSARWPGPDGPGHLYGAGLWVGAELLGQKLVSTGQYETEFRPTDDISDKIYELGEGFRGARRYPASDADDDGDGLEDEDPFNGRDDDLDGQVDEDGAGMADQHFRCEYSDTLAVSAENYPDHASLGLSVIAQSLQWSADEADDFVGFDFTLINNGAVQLENVYVGLFADFDIRDVGSDITGAEDDLSGCYQGMAPGNDGSYYPVEIAYSRDGAGLSGSGCIGILLLDHPVDPTGATAPVAHGLRANRIFSGQTAFDEGGDPVNDDQRYELLSTDRWDADTSVPGDYRQLISVGPFPVLAPRDSLAVRFAMVAGADKPAMLRNATEAIRAWRGKRFDRDGDPSTGPEGCEYAVHWLWEQATVVAVEGGKLTAAHADGGVEVAVDLPDKGPADLRVERRGPQGDLRVWSLEALAAIGPSDLRIEFRDEDPAGWPRVYRLLRRCAAGDVELDSIQLDGPPSSSMSLSVHPNPCNPGAVIEFGLPEPGRAVLTIHDAAGRLIARLAGGDYPSGASSVEWDGRDAHGRKAAAGTYFVRIATPLRIETRKLTVVK